MWIFCSFFSLFTKTTRSHPQRNNVQCKRLCYFYFPTRHCFNSRCTFALLSSCTCVGVKMRHVEGNLQNYRGEFTKFRSISPTWSLNDEDGSSFSTLESAAALGPKTRKMYRINKNLWNVLVFFSAGWLIKRPSSIILDFVSGTIFHPLSLQWIWLLIYSRPRRGALIYPHIENVTITVQMFTERFWKCVISMCDYRHPAWRKGSRNDCWWAVNYCSSREVQSNQLLTSHSVAGA